MLGRFAGKSPFVYIIFKLVYRTLRQTIAGTQFGFYQIKFQAIGHLFIRHGIYAIRHIGDALSIERMRA